MNCAARLDLVAHQRREDRGRPRRRPRPRRGPASGCAGSIVVSQSSSAFISPRPLKRLTCMPSFASSSAWSRSSSNVSARSRFLPSVIVNGGGPAISRACAYALRRPCVDGRARAARPARPTCDAALVSRSMTLHLERRRRSRRRPRARSRSASIVASARRDVLRGVDGPTRRAGARRRSWRPGRRSPSAGAPTSPRTRAARARSVPQRASVSLIALPVRSVTLHLRHALADEQLLELRLLLDVALLVAELDAVERRDGDVDVAALDELLHVPVEEREDAACGCARRRRRRRSSRSRGGSGASRCRTRRRCPVPIAVIDRLDLRVREHLVDPVLLGVDHLPAQRQDRLEEPVARVASPSRRPSCPRRCRARRTRGRGSGSRRACPAATTPPSALLRRVSSRALRAAWRARAAEIAFVMICLRVGRVLLEELGEPLR